MALTGPYVYNGVALPDAVVYLTLYTVEDQAVVIQPNTTNANAAVFANAAAVSGGLPLAWEQVRFAYDPAAGSLFVQGEDAALLLPQFAGMHKI